MQIPAFNSVKAIAAGQYHSLALKNDGTVWAWGWNNYGQLGNGGNFISPVPVQVAGLTNIIAISAGGNNSIALKSDSTVWEWGYLINSNVPVQRTSLSGITDIAYGWYHGLALKSDSTVWAWGTGTEGELGDGTGYSSYVIPIKASGLTGVVAIAAGYDYSIALKKNGTVWTYGGNYYGQTGNGVTGTNERWPVRATSITGIITIAGGGWHCLAEKNDGTLWTWGNDMEQCSYSNN